MLYAHNKYCWLYGTSAIHHFEYTERQAFYIVVVFLFLSEDLRSYILEVSAFLGRGSASPGEYFPNFRDDVVITPSRIGIFGLKT